MPEQTAQPQTKMISLSNKKVCMIVNQNYYTDTRVISYANALAESSAQVHVIYAKQSLNSCNSPDPNIRIFSIPITKSNESGLGYIVNYILSIIYFTFYASALFLRYRYQVIHVHNMPDTLIFSALIPKLFGSKVILDIHDPMPNVFMSKYNKGFESRLVRLLVAQERLSASLANEVITANPIFKDELSQRGIPKEKILVVNNIPNPQVFRRDLLPDKELEPSDKFILIYPGTIAARYSLDIPIRALPWLRKEIPNIQLKMIGKRNQYADDLIKLAAQLNVSEYVEVIPHLPASQIAIEIAKADVGIYAALPDAHMDIAMPGKVLEYVTMGIPVVATRLRILEAFFDDSSIFFFSPGDIAQFSDHVLELFRDPVLRNKFVKNADEVFTNKYPWKEEFIRYLHLVNGLVNP